MKTEITPIHTLKANNNGHSSIELPYAELAQSPVLPVGPSAADLVPGRKIRPLASLKAHMLLALLVALAVMAVGAPLAWMKGKAKYYTEAVVRVSPRFLKNLHEDQELELQSNSQYREF